MTTYGYKMCYALSFAKERFAAVSETTKDKKVRREWRVFPLLTINLLKPFSRHLSLYKVKEVLYPLQDGEV